MGEKDSLRHKPSKLASCTTLSHIDIQWHMALELGSDSVDLG